MFSRTIFALAMVLPLLVANGGARTVSNIGFERLRIESALVYKFPGYGPLDVLARVVDRNGKPVDDATVIAAYAEIDGVSALKSIGNGNYLGCNLGAAAGMPVITVAASKAGMLPAELKVKPKPGRLCVEERPGS